MLNYIKKCGLAWLLALAMLFTMACDGANIKPTDTTANTQATENVTETAPDEVVTDTDIPDSSEGITETESDSAEPTESVEITETKLETTESEETEYEETEPEIVGSVTILNGSEKTIEVGEGFRLIINKSSSVTEAVKWTATGGHVTVDVTGYVTGVSVGDAVVIVSAGKAVDTILIHVVAKSAETTAPETTEAETEPEEETEPMGLPTVNEEQRDQFYGNSTPPKNNQEATDRSNKGQLSGADVVPDQAPTLSEYRPMINGQYVRNKDMYYADEDTYIVVNAYGEEVFRVYRGGAYITLEEVAAYVYAFGDIPANYVSGKNTKPSSSIFGKYLRLNHSRFSGSTSSYPYEPELPNISGCGGTLRYYEIDIGTTGTDCDPNYAITIYNNGTKITRGAARIVYTKYDGDGDGVIELDEIYVFYTYNHYNDFQEYLNYYGGWGEMFGNVTGGGKLSSKTDYNPTPYVPVVLKSVRAMAAENKQAKTSAEPVYFIAMILPEDLYHTRKF